MVFHRVPNLGTSLCTPQFGALFSSMAKMQIILKKYMKPNDTNKISGLQTCLYEEFVFGSVHFRNRLSSNLVTLDDMMLVRNFGVIFLIIL